jgi:dihydrofolate synthase/folylpolyglutamate synthase
LHYLHIDVATGTIPPFESAGEMTNKEIDQKYQSALDYLYSFVDYSMTRALRYSPDKFDLGRMRVFMDALGNPQMDYPILHVAGTKGKGSTAALCANALKVAGYQTGLYTSPHLEDYTERIQLNGKAIAHAELVDLVEYIKPYVSRIPALTTFEITSALAFIFFSRQQADVMVAEVGLGGRLDATNIITPVISIITSLSMDHMNVLGNSLAEIAGEKCGIIKPGIPVVSSPQQPEALAVIEAYAQKMGSPLILIGRDVHYEPVAHSLDMQSMKIWQEKTKEGARDGGQAAHEVFEMPLLGAHQMDNAATAYAALELCNQIALPVPLEAIQEGFRSVEWPGRFEIISKKPFIVIDSAHNIDSASRLRQTLDDYLPGNTVQLIFGASEDKDVGGILKELAPRVSKVYATRSEHPRALDPQLIAGQCRILKLDVIVLDNVETSLERACQETGEGSVILATGSIFIAAAVKMIYRNGRMNSHEK